MNVLLKKIDKNNLKTYRFEEIATKISKTVMPNLAEVDIYVGLEHIDSEDIHIKRYGTPSDVSGGKLRCYPGDVIFGKRRAYQRKAAIVEFNGICSAHAFVFRANKDVIDPKLLPFFLHSDQFMNKMVDISVGGLSPTINWGDLKYLEFHLPEKKKQAKIIKLLWEIDGLIRKYNKIKALVELNAKVLAKDHFKSLRNKKNIKLGEICRPKQWKTIPAKRQTKDGFLLYGANGIVGHFSEYNHEFPVIAISCRGDCGSVHLTKPKSYINGNAMCLDDLDTDRYNIKYLFYYLYYSNLDPIITGSAVPQIIRDDIENFKIKEVDHKKQFEFINKFDLLSENIDKIDIKIKSSKLLLKKLINKIF